LALKFIKGENRHQLCLFPVSIDQSVEEDNEVRFIDLFVDSPDLSTIGFKSDFVENGLDTQSILTKRTGIQADRILLFEQLTQNKKKPTLRNTKRAVITNFFGSSDYLANFVNLFR